MDDHLFPEWRVHNSRIRYPFSDIATLTNDDGIAFGDDVFLDARLYPAGGLERQYLSRISISVTEVELEISDSNGALASSTIDKTAVPVEVPLEDEYGRPAGLFVIDTVAFASISSWAIGDYQFSADQTEFVSTVTVPVPQSSAVRAIVVGDEIFTGDVFIVGEDGVVLSVEDGRLRVDLVGDPYFLDTLCGELSGSLSSYVADRTFLKTINNIGPDEYGDFKIVVGGNVVDDPIIRVNLTEHGVRLKAIGTQIRQS